MYLLTSIPLSEYSCILKSTTGRQSCTLLVMRWYVSWFCLGSWPFHTFQLSTVSKRPVVQSPIVYDPNSQLSKGWLSEDQLQLSIYPTYTLYNWSSDNWPFRQLDSWKLGFRLWTTGLLNTGLETNFVKDQSSTRPVVRLASYPKDYLK